MNEEPISIGSIFDAIVDRHAKGDLVRMALVAEQRAKREKEKPESEE